MGLQRQRGATPLTCTAYLCDTWSTQDNLRVCAACFPAGQLVVDAGGKARKLFGARPNSREEVATLQARAAAAADVAAAAALHADRLRRAAEAAAALVTPSPAKALKRQGEDLERATDEVKRRRLEQEADAEKIAAMAARLAELEARERRAVEPLRFDRLCVDAQTKDLAASFTGLPTWDVAQAVFDLAMGYHKDLPLHIYHGDLMEVAPGAAAAAPPVAAGAAPAIGDTHGKGFGSKRKQRSSRAKDPAAPSRRGGARAGTGHVGRTALGPKDQYLLTLFVMRTGATQALAGALFGVDPSTAARYFVTWVRFLADVLAREMPWPSQAEIRATTPVKWERVLRGRHARVIVDGTELPMEVASEPQAQRATWSEYKARVRRWRRRRPFLLCAAREHDEVSCGAVASRRGDVRIAWVSRCVLAVRDRPTCCAHLFQVESPTVS